MLVKYRDLETLLLGLRFLNWLANWYTSLAGRTSPEQVVPIVQLGRVSIQPVRRSQAAVLVANRDNR